MPLRTAVFAVALERFGRSSILDLDEEQIRNARQWAAPARWPHTWVTGGVSGRVSIREARFPTRDGVERPVRIYSPIHARGPLPIVLFFHGGGYVLGNTRMYDPLCSFLAKSIPAVVVSVDYRQAPEFRAPTALHDSVDGLRWAHANAESFRGDPARIAVCGDSAGGGLAALVCHAAYDEGGPAIAHQALLYPCTDATQSFPSAAEHGAAPVLSAEKIRVFTEHYLADVVDPTDPIVSAYWRKDLRGMPPALVQTADLDPLRDEGLAYAERLSDAGVPVRATNYLRTVHGFMSFPGATTIGEQARYELLSELRRHLNPTRLTQIVPVGDVGAAKA
ncbi:MAG: alpha/beta hydrolase [Actinomycetales bacterium]|jgi:acetyl esterase|nr:alpha/beta hydrolase [Candidatus Phosphoribacter baldrii]